LVRQIEVLVAQEEPQSQLARLLGQLGQHWHIRQRVAAPVLGDDERVNRLGQAVEERDILWSYCRSRLVRHEGFAVLLHLRCVLLERHALLKPLTSDRHCAANPCHVRLSLCP